MRLWLLVGIFAIICTSSFVHGDKNDPEFINKINEAPTFQKKMLARRREEHFALLKGVAQNQKYEWRYQLVEIGVTKVFGLINKNRKNEQEGGSDAKMTEYKMLIIENSCLLMDFIVNFNEDIYSIIKKVAKDFDWHETLKFMMDYLEKEVDLLDELTTNEFEFIKENYDDLINERPLPAYPFENNVRKDINMTERFYKNEKDLQKELKKKEKQKQKKGPKLQLPTFRSKTEL